MSGALERFADDRRSFPVHNIEAEQALLGAILVNNEVVDRIGALRPEHFYDPMHARIFDEARRAIMAGDLASPITIKGRFAGDEGLAELGGPAYLARLAGAAITIGHANDYAEIVIDAWVRRKVMEATERAQNALSAGEPVDKVTGALEGEIAALTDETRRSPLLISWSRALADTLDEINEAYQNERPAATPTGIRALDRIIAGLFPGDMIVLGGRPSMGKSALASSVAVNVLQGGGGVIFCSLEMTTSGLVVRVMSELLARDGRPVPYVDMRNGLISEESFRHLVEKMRAVENFPILITPPSVQDVAKLRSAIRRGAQMLAAKGAPLKLVVFDYLQLADDPSERTIDRISAISKALKNAAKQFNVPVLTLSQLSRGVESRDNKRPRLSDLRDSGSIEQDADVVLFCYRHEYYVEREKPEASDIDALDKWNTAMSRCAGRMEIIVAKQRMGPIGVAHTIVDLKTNHFPQDQDRQEGMVF